MSQSRARDGGRFNSPALHQTYFDPSRAAVVPHNRPTLQPPGRVPGRPQ